MNRALYLTRDAAILASCLACSRYCIDKYKEYHIFDTKILPLYSNAVKKTIEAAKSKLGDKYTPALYLVVHNANVISTDVNKENDNIIDMELEIKEKVSQYSGSGRLLRAMELMERRILGYSKVFKNFIMTHTNYYSHTTEKEYEFKLPKDSMKLEALNEYYERFYWIQNTTQCMMHVSMENKQWTNVMMHSLVLAISSATYLFFASKYKSAIYKEVSNIHSKSNRILALSVLLVLLLSDFLKDFSGRNFLKTSHLYGLPSINQLILGESYRSIDKTTIGIDALNFHILGFLNQYFDSQELRSIKSIMDQQTISLDDVKLSEPISEEFRPEEIAFPSINAPIEAAKDAAKSTMAIARSLDAISTGIWRRCSQVQPSSDKVEMHKERMSSMSFLWKHYISCKNVPSNAAFSMKFSMDTTSTALKTNVSLPGLSFHLPVGGTLSDPFTPARIFYDCLLMPVFKVGLFQGLIFPRFTMLYGIAGSFAACFIQSHMNSFGDYDSIKSVCGCEPGSSSSFEYSFWRAVIMNSTYIAFRSLPLCFVIESGTAIMNIFDEFAYRTDIIRERSYLWRFMLYLRQQSLQSLNNGLYSYMLNQKALTDFKSIITKKGFAQDISVSTDTDWSHYITDDQNDMLEKLIDDVLKSYGSVNVNVHGKNFTRLNRADAIDLLVALDYALSGTGKTKYMRNFHDPWNHIVDGAPIGKAAIIAVKPDRTKEVILELIPEFQEKMNDFRIKYKQMLDELGIHGYYNHAGKINLKALNSSSHSYSYLTLDAHRKLRDLYRLNSFPQDQHNATTLSISSVLSYIIHVIKGFVSYPSSRLPPSENALCHLQALDSVFSQVLPQTLNREETKNVLKLWALDRAKVLPGLTVNEIEDEETQIKTAIGLLYRIRGSVLAYENLDPQSIYALWLNVCKDFERSSLDAAHSFMNHYHGSGHDSQIIPYPHSGSLAVRSLGSQSVDKYSRDCRTMHNAFRYTNSQYQRWISAYQSRESVLYLLQYGLTLHRLRVLLQTSLREDEKRLFNGEKLPNASQIRDERNRTITLEQALLKGIMDSEKSYISKAYSILNPNKHLGNSRIINAPFIHLRKVQSEHNVKSPPPSSPSSKIKNNTDKGHQDKSKTGQNSKSDKTDKSND